MNAQFCSECGTKADGNFCSECGRNLQQFKPNDQQNQAQYTNDQSYTKYVQTYSGMNNLNLEDFKTIVGGNPAENNYYTENYIKMRITHSSVSWNWAAFLLAIPWALYRKMYLQAVIMLAIVYILPEQLIYITSLGVMIFSGMFGNYFYFKRVEKHMEAVKKLSEPEIEVYRKDHSGVSILAATLGYAALIAAFLIADIVLFSVLSSLKESL